VLVDDADGSPDIAFASHADIEHPHHPQIATSWR
jgi:hypothetical protein